MPKTEPTYQELNGELEAILANLQHDDTDIDEAVEQYQKGLELIKQLEARLKTASNTIEELKASFKTD